MKPSRPASGDVRLVPLTPDTIAEYGVCGYKDAQKHVELQRKIAWFAQYYPKGLRITALVAESGGYQGMIEYLPGELAHRPVSAAGYLFIHCVFVGFKKEFKGKGYGSLLIESCVEEARLAGKRGVAVVTRDGSFMARKEVFAKLGFRITDRAKPDFQLMALTFDQEAAAPSSIGVSAAPSFIETSAAAAAYPEGLTVFRSPQCPYSVKNVDAILKTAERLEISATLVELEDHESAQRAPCPFGAFCIVHDGEVISHHPISNTRFENIMRSRVRAGCDASATSGS